MSASDIIAIVSIVISLAGIVVSAYISLRVAKLFRSQLEVVKNSRDEFFKLWQNTEYSERYMDEYKIAEDSYLRALEELSTYHWKRSIIHSEIKADLQELLAMEWFDIDNKEEPYSKLKELLRYYRKHIT